jgi:outer membrane assembly lipoprotein YfiO
MDGHDLRVLGLRLALITSLVGGFTSAASAQDKFELKDDGFKKIAAPDPNSPEGQLQAMRRLIAEEKYEEAQDQAKEWIDAHPNHPLLAQAYLIRGDAYAADTEHYLALFDYEYIIRAYPGSEQFEVANERELTIAEAFVRGVKRKFWGMRIIPAESEGEELLIRIQERMPGSRIAERAGLELADYYYRASEMEMAATAYELFLVNYPQSQWREHAMQRQILANLASFKGPAFDATGLVEAQRRLIDYKTQFPAAAEQLGAHALLTRVDESLAERSLLVAQWYDDRGKFVSARFMYQRVMRDHPGSAAAYKAMNRLKELDPKAYAETVEQVKTQPPTVPAELKTPEGPTPPQPSPAAKPIPGTPDPGKQSSVTNPPPASPEHPVLQSRPETAPPAEPGKLSPKPNSP